jgi:uncharacterized LabA/DUF88 family protein
MAARFYFGGAMSKRSIVYVDGFNFYYGMVRNTAYKWLNLQKLFERIRQDDDMLRINYFSSRASGSAGQRHAVYFRALESLPKMRIILGKFKTMQVHCRVRSCHFDGPRMFSTEIEKRTDVNIAIQLLDDAYQNAADRFVVVSGDSDLVPSLMRVRERFPEKKIIVYVPARDEVRGAAVEIRNAAHKHSTLDENIFKYCLLPDRLKDSCGRDVVKPESW